MILHGNSLEILTKLESNLAQTVYIDPPFNSGRDYRISPENIVGFNDTWSNDEEYENFIEELVSKSKKIMKKDGNLFLHISATEMFIPHKVCLRHFKNVKPIFWKKSRSKNNTKNTLGAAIDVIFWCFDSPKKKFNLVYQQLDKKYLEGSYNNIDTRGKYALGHLVADPTRKGTYFYSYSIDGRVFEPPRGWRISKEELDILVADNRIHIPVKKDANLYKKIYLHESLGKPCMDLWDDIHSIAQGNEKRLYPTEKPIALLERIILMSTDVGDLVLDPCAGSGTTGLAAKMLNRNYILIDKNIDSIKVINSRLEISSE